MTTSSRRHTSSPGSNGPSIRFAVPYSLVSPRTMMNGRPDAIAAEAANATAPRAGPASRTASGSHSLHGRRRERSPSARRISGSVSKRYLSRYQDERRPERRTKSPSSSARSTSERAELVVRHVRSAERAIGRESLEARRAGLEDDRRAVGVRDAGALLGPRRTEELPPRPDRERDEDGEPDELPHSDGSSFGLRGGASLLRLGGLDRLHAGAEVVDDEARRRLRPRGRRDRPSAVAEDEDTRRPRARPRRASPRGRRRRDPQPPNELERRALPASSGAAESSGATASTVPSASRTTAAVICDESSISSRSACVRIHGADASSVQRSASSCASARAARARCECSAFQRSPSSATVSDSPRGTKIGS